MSGRTIPEEISFRDECREFYEDATEDVKFLKAIWGRIDSPERWIKGAHARLFDGVLIPYWKVAETLGRQWAWSLYGAIETEGRMRYPNATERMERILRARQALSLACRRKHESTPMISITDYNDRPDTSHEDIRDLIEYAIDVRWEQDRTLKAKTFWRANQRKEKETTT